MKMEEPRRNVIPQGKRAKACSNCRRRKERCDGEQPCGRCTSRNVPNECQTARRTSTAKFSSAPDSVLRIRGSSEAQLSADENTAVDFMEEIQLQTSNQSSHTSQSHGLLGLEPETPSASVHAMSRLLRGFQGNYMFIGDSANLSFLQTIRKVVKDSVGECPLTQDQLRYQMLEAVPQGPAAWLKTNARHVPPTLTLQEATYLVRRYSLAANCVLDLFDEAALLENLAPWLERPPDETDVLSTTYYLVFALGAQTCPEDKEQLAEACFNTGRYFTALSFTEDPSISTVQAYALITMYLLNSSRRNAAFMNLGTGVRAAYALGLHRREVAELFTPTEYRTRERLWKVIRILDLFMSTSLGRPPSTTETRDTSSTKDYSASASLCMIFEKILNDVYSRRMVSTETVKDISGMHRSWTERFSQGLALDGISPTEMLENGRLPNIGILHVKEAYYWTVMLSTRPFLVDAVTSYSSKSIQQTLAENGTCASSYSEPVLVHGCVDSAIRTIDLLCILLDSEDIPKRLPFVVNSIFVSALVLGLAHFGDLGKIFPVDASLTQAHRLLGRFPHDAIARRNMTIVTYLIQACETITAKRRKLNHDRQTLLVGKVFGHMPGYRAVNNPTKMLAGGMADGSIRVSQGAPNPSDREHQPLDALNAGRSSAWQLGATLEEQYQDTGSTPLDLRSGQEESQTLHDPFIDAYLTCGGFSESMPPLSPRTLWFDSWGEKFPLFSTIENTNTT